MRSSASRLALLVAALLAASSARAEDPRERFGLKLDSREKMVISSDQLEAQPAEAGDHVIFRKNVRAVQGQMTLSCDWLEAVYPKGGGGNPDRITARGSVSILQAGNEARCAEAVVDTRAQTAECRSADPLRAELLRENGVMRADTIYFDLAKGIVRAVGNTVVEIDPPAEEGGEP